MLTKKFEKLSAEKLNAIKGGDYRKHVTFLFFLEKKR